MCLVARPSLSKTERNNLASPEAAEPRPLQERIRIDGDFRYRYEEIDVQGSEVHQRTRIRARASIATDIADTVDIGFGIATGGFSPTSSTQTLANGGSKKDVALDLAYVDWTPIDGLHVLAGKFRNHLDQVPSQILLWDNEWRPEGIGLKYQSDLYFASFLGTWLESDSLAPQREWAVGGHAGIYRPIGDAWLTAGAGYFDIGIAGKGTFYGPDLAFAGNSFGCADPQESSSCSYSYDYREVELFAALDFDISDVSAEVYGHIVRNLDADQFNTGWTAGARLRTTLRGHGLQFDYFYRDLEADAVYAQLTDSDFGGGGTDVKGHYFKAGWSVTPQWVLSVIYHMNRIGADAGNQRDYDRLQLNVDFTY